MPIRWGIYHPQNVRQAMLATETGVWTTNHMEESSPVWEPVNDGMANVRVDMLSMRESDNTVLAATHGRGFFTTTWDVVTGVKNNHHPAFNVYPNPTNGILNVSYDLKGSGICLIEIINQEGQLVREEQVSPVSGKIDMTGMPAGIYYLKFISNGKAVKAEKIIKY